MKFKNSSKIIITILAMICSLAMFACQKQDAQSPTEAYKMLFTAVKSKDSAKIKAVLSKATLGLAQMASSQQNKPVEKVIENGFTQTTFSDELPQMRDERVKDTFGALEVWNDKAKQWEDLPFINEDGSWKLAVGNIFNKTYEKPSKGQAEIERENANVNNPNAVIERIPTNNSSIPKNANIQRLSNTNTANMPNAFSDNTANAKK